MQKTKTKRKTPPQNLFQQIWNEILFTRWYRITVQDSVQDVAKRLRSIHDKIDGRYKSQITFERTPPDAEIPFEIKTFFDERKNGHFSSPFANSKGTIMADGEDAIIQGYVQMDGNNWGAAFFVLLLLSGLITADIVGSGGPVLLAIVFVAIICLFYGYAGWKAYHARNYLINKLQVVAHNEKSKKAKH